MNKSREKFIWTTKNGDCMYIHEMTDSHIINSIKYLKRKIILDNPKIPRSEIEELLPESYWHLHEEAVTRNLIIKSDGKCINNQQRSKGTVNLSNPLGNRRLEL